MTTYRTPLRAPPRWISSSRAAARTVRRVARRRAAGDGLRPRRPRAQRARLAARRVAPTAAPRPCCPRVGGQAVEVAGVAAGLVEGREMSASWRVSLRPRRPGAPSRSPSAMKSRRTCDLCPARHKPHLQRDFASHADGLAAEKDLGERALRSASSCSGRGRSTSTPATQPTSSAPSARFAANSNRSSPAMPARPHGKCPRQIGSHARTEQRSGWRNDSVATAGRGLVVAHAYERTARDVRLAVPLVSQNSPFRLPIISIRLLAGRTDQGRTAPGLARAARPGARLAERPFLPARRRRSWGGSRWRC